MQVLTVRMRQSNKMGQELKTRQFVLEYTE